MDNARPSNITHLLHFRDINRLIIGHILLILLGHNNEN